MPFQIVFTREAVEDMRGLNAFDRSRIQSAVQGHLMHEPEKLSKSRIKRLRGLIRPQYRLRVDDWRVYYDVIDSDVVIYGVIPKSGQDDWLHANGESETEETDHENGDDDRGSKQPPDVPENG